MYQESIRLPIYDAKLSSGTSSRPVMTCSENHVTTDRKEMGNECKWPMDSALQLGLHEQHDAAGTSR